MMRIDKEQLKRCPSCGHFFSCFSENDCWCESYQIPQNKAKELWNKYEGCICPKCLKKYEV